VGFKRLDRVFLMNFIVSDLPGVIMIEPRVYGDQRGFFFESFNHRLFHEHTGLNPRFVQDNHSRSAKNVLRGLHYQVKQTQGKLVRVVAGEVFDVAVDIRKSSPHFGKWAGFVLSAENKRSVWIPEGYAHGFLVLSDAADFVYKTTDFYAAEHERSILWNDPEIGIDWPLTGEPVLAPKDRSAHRLAEAEVFE
jgi:dTDP-4-dehydrorhamnose 3,5-epimerase